MCVQAIDRGVAFEVSYSAAIRDATMRRYTIANAVSLMETCKGKVGPFCPSRLPVAVVMLGAEPEVSVFVFQNVILSSAAEQVCDQSAHQVSAAHL